MKKILGYSLIILMLIFVSTSCDDVLEQKSVDSFTEESVFQDSAAAAHCAGRVNESRPAGSLWKQPFVMDALGNNVFKH